MKLIEADKVEQAIKDYWKAQVDKLPIPKSIEEHDERVNRLDAILEHNDGLLKEIEALPSAELDTTTHDSIPAKTSKNDGDGTSGDCISRQQAIEVLRNRWLKTRNYEGIGEDIAEECEIYLKTLPSVQPNLQPTCNQLAIDCISRQQAIDALRDYLVGKRCPDDGTLTCRLIENEVINKLPSAQPDIIHCKDCAYCDSDVVDAPYGMTKKVWWCNRLYAGANENLIVEPDDFCSWAERRE